MQDVALLQGGPQRTVHAVLEVERALPGDHVWKEIPVERRVVLEQLVQGKDGLGGDQFVEANLARRYPGPVARRQAVVGVGPVLPNRFEDQLITSSARSVAGQTLPILDTDPPDRYP